MIDKNEPAGSSRTYRDFPVFQFDEIEPSNLHQERKRLV